MFATHTQPSPTPCPPYQYLLPTVAPSPFLPNTIPGLALSPHTPTLTQTRLSQQPCAQISSAPQSASTPQAARSLQFVDPSTHTPGPVVLGMHIHSTELGLHCTVFSQARPSHVDAAHAPLRQNPETQMLPHWPQLLGSVRMTEHAGIFF